jgi:hypothetical protein
MNNLDPTVKLINGPTNIVRLEGNINGINKILYLFMDWHVDVDSQSECTNIFSEDIKKYFADSFYNLNGSDITYDFFVEILPKKLKFPDENNNTNDIIRNKYILQIIKFFDLLFTYDKKRNRVKINDVFNNVRFHYFDVRSQMDRNIMAPITYAYDDSYDLLYKSEDSEILIDIADQLFDALGELESFTSILINKNRNTSKDILSFVNKIKQSYQHKNVKKIMAQLYINSVNDFKNLIINIRQTIDKIEEYYKIFRNTENTFVKDNKYSGGYGYGYNPITLRNMSTDVLNSCEEIYETAIETFARLIDIYFLRRFLDKDYITNAIVFSGAAHSNTYVKFLVNYFNFKITHASYSSIKDLSKLEKEIKMRNKKNQSIMDLLNPKELFQCSDMTNFPDNFL